jgi:hypothetical protein
MLLHRRNLANDTGGGGGVLGTLIYEGVKLERGGKIGLKQSLIHTHLFPTLSTSLLFAPSQLGTQKKTILR